MSARVLCVNMNYIGDAIMTTPALDCLARVSGQPVDVIASRAALEGLKGNPSVGQTFPRTAKGSFERCAQLTSVVRQAKYTDVVILPSIPIYATTAKLAGAKQVFVVPKMPAGTHLATHMVRSVESHFSIEPQPVKLKLSVDPEAKKSVENLLDEHKLLRPFVLFNIGASRPQKRWPVEYFARTATSLLNKGISVIVSGGKDDLETAAELSSSVRHDSFLNITGKTTIAELIALISISDVVLTADTAAVHLAAALEVPTVALFGSTDPETTGPIGDGKRVVLYDKIFCSPCNSHPTCGGAFTCMKGLEPGRVVGAIMSVLPQTDERRA